jgi:hypothetical protein
MQNFKGVTDVILGKIGGSDRKIQSDRRDPQKGRNPDGVQDDIRDRGLSLPGPPVEESKRPDAQQKTHARSRDENDQGKRHAL